MRVVFPARTLPSEPMRENLYQKLCSPAEPSSKLLIKDQHRLGDFKPRKLFHRKLN